MMVATAHGAVLLEQQPQLMHGVTLLAYRGVVSGADLPAQPCGRKSGAGSRIEGQCDVDTRSLNSPFVSAGVVSRQQT